MSENFEELLHRRRGVRGEAWYGGCGWGETWAGRGRHKKEGNGGHKTEGKGTSFTPDGGFLVLTSVKKSLWMPCNGANTNISRSEYEEH